MQTLGLPLKSDEIMLGTEFKTLSLSQLKLKIAKVKLFARTTPDQKLIIVKALQEMGEVVAMTGDGVNDAPALKRADIGIVVSNASDVSKETADVVLLDNNFATILSAVEEDRGIFENLRKVLLYLLSDSYSELVILMGSLLMGLPIPLTAAQILWINLVNDSLPNLALTVDPNGKQLLKDKPRARDAQFIDRQMGFLIGLISVVTGLSVLAAFWWVYKTTGDVHHARTVAFAMSGFDSLLYVFSTRNLRSPIWVEGFFKNPWLVLACVSGFIFQCAALYLPFFQAFFNTRPLQLIEWILVFCSAMSVMILIEAVKWSYSYRRS